MRCRGLFSVRNDFVSEIGAGPRGLSEWTAGGRFKFHPFGMYSWCALPESLLRMLATSATVQNPLIQCAGNFER
jgi:hypothetical protein